MQMSQLIKEGGWGEVGWVGGEALRRGELNKDVSRPDRERKKKKRKERGREGGRETGTCMESNQGSLISWR